LEADLQDDVATSRAEIQLANAQALAAAAEALDTAEQTAATAFKKQRNAQAAQFRTIRATSAQDREQLVAEVQRVKQERDAAYQQALAVAEESGNGFAQADVELQQAKAQVEQQAAEFAQEHRRPFFEARIRQRDADPRADQSIWHVFADLFLGSAIGAEEFNWREYWKGVGDVFLGYKDAIVGFVESAWNTIRHPIKTAKGIWNAVTHPAQTWEAIKKDYKEKWKTNRGKGEIFGEILIDLGTAGAGKATKPAKFTKWTRKTPDAKPKATRAVKQQAAKNVGGSKALKDLRDVENFVPGRKQHRSDTCGLQCAADAAGEAGGKINVTPELRKLIREQGGIEKRQLQKLLDDALDDNHTALMDRGFSETQLIRRTSQSKPIVFVDGNHWVRVTKAFKRDGRWYVRVVDSGVGGSYDQLLTSFMTRTGSNNVMIAIVGPPK